MSDSEHNQPTYDDIARLAYDRFLARGRAHGFALEDWLAAEQEARLRQTGVSDATGTAAPAPTDGAATKTPRRRLGDRNATRPHSATVAPRVLM